MEFTIQYEAATQDDLCGICGKETKPPKDLDLFGRDEKGELRRVCILCRVEHAPSCMRKFLKLGEVTERAHQSSRFSRSLMDTRKMDDEDTRVILQAASDYAECTMQGRRWCADRIEQLKMVSQSPDQVEIVVKMFSGGPGPLLDSESHADSVRESGTDFDERRAMDGKVEEEPERLRQIIRADPEWRSYAEAIAVIAQRALRHPVYMEDSIFMINRLIAEQEDRIDQIQEKDRHPDGVGLQRYFGSCPVCERGGICHNIGRDHWMACDEHQIKWHVGSNLFSGWRSETEEDWAENNVKLREYRTTDYPNR